VDEYLERVRSRSVAQPSTAISEAPPKVAAKQQRQDQRAVAKEMTKIERAIAKLDDAERGLHEQMAEAATDHSRLADLNRELQETQIRKAELEDEWMRLAAELEG
jgi:ATP-binding cassette subfamily F protein uup